MNRWRLLRRLATAIGIGLFVGWLGNFFLNPPLVRLSEAPTLEEGAGKQKERTTLPFLVKNGDVSTVLWAKAIQSASGPEIRDFLEQWESAGGPEARKALRALAFKRWFMIEPKNAWEYAHTRALRDEDEAWIREALAVWSEHDARAAAEIVGDGAIPQRWRWLAEHAIIAQIGEEDPERMLGLAREFGFRSFSQIFSLLARVDPELAAAKTLEMPSERVLGSVIVEWAAQGGCDEAFRWMQEHANESQSYLLAVLGPIWASQDPEAAAAHVDALSGHESTMRGNLIGRIAAEWWQRDSEAAQAWLDKITPEGAEAEAVQQYMISQLALTDPEAALVLVRDAIEAGFSPKLSPLPSKWKSREPATVEAWIEALPEGRSRDSALTQWWKHQFEQNPVKVLESLPKQLEQLKEEAADYTALANQAIQALRGRGPGAAEGWIDRLPERHRASFAARYATTLSDHDPEAALAFLSKRFTEDSASAPTFQRIISTWARQDPAKAAEHALAEPDRQRRELAVSNVASVWKVTDPGAAKRLLESID